MSVIRMTQRRPYSGLFRRLHLAIFHIIHVCYDTTASVSRALNKSFMLLTRPCTSMFKTRVQPPRRPYKIDGTFFPSSA